ncbi:MAG: hypothetical protein Q9220_005473 [cf. Caloplaca sp. 1 TL-2023]
MASSQNRSSSVTQDFQPGQATTTGTQQPSKVEQKLAREGHLPGLEEVKNDKEPSLRQPGQEDAAGNKIHHKSTLKKLFHWEHNGMNAD